MRPIGTHGKDERDRGEVSASPLHIVAAPDSYRKMLPIMYVTARDSLCPLPPKKSAPLTCFLPVFCAALWAAPKNREESLRGRSRSLRGVPPDLILSKPFDTNKHQKNRPRV